MTVKGLKNLRDLGGVRVADGRVVKHGLILRSASCDALSEEDCRALVEDYHLSTVIDLRTDLEVEELPDVVIPGVEYLRIPVFHEGIIGITKETGSDIGEYIKHTWNRKAIRAALPDMHQIYSYALSDMVVVGKIREAIHVVIANTLAGRTTLFHCSQGKDRTGAVGALILSLLGAGDEAVFDDYERGGAAYRWKALKDAVLITIFKLDPKAAGIAYHASLAERSFIAASYRTMDNIYASRAEFFREHLGVSDELRERFAAAVLV